MLRWENCTTFRYASRWSDSYSCCCCCFSLLLLFFLLTWVVFLGKAQQPQEQRYPFLRVCAVFLCVKTMVRLPVFWIFNMCTDVDACNCTWGMYWHHKRVCTESWLWDKNLSPTSTLHPNFQSDALPTELSPLPWLLMNQKLRKNGAV